MMSATCGRSTRRHVAEAPHLAFAGLQAYHGSAQHLRGWDERRQAIAQAVDRADHRPRGGELTFVVSPYRIPVETRSVAVSAVGVDLGC